MAIVGATVGLNNYCCQTTSNGCPDLFGCPSGVCPDFTIKRHDTRPAFKILLEDCDGAIDLTDQNLVLEANIWARAKIKKDIGVSDTYFALADNVGFQQIMTGDVIVFDRVRLPEYMLVLGFDEANKLIEVQRGYRGTIPSVWKKGTPMRIFRNINATAQIETTLHDVKKEDGTVLIDQIKDTFLVYNWDVKDTCTPGCYWLEFKLLKMLPLVATPDTISIVYNEQAIIDVLANDYNPDGRTITISDVENPVHGTASISDDNKIVYTPDTDYVGEDIFNYSVTDGIRTQSAQVIVNIGIPMMQSLSYDSPSNISFTPSTLSGTDFGCFMGLGVEWVRRFPIDGEAFLIRIIDSPTAEF